MGIHKAKHVVTLCCFTVWSLYGAALAVGPHETHRITNAPLLDIQAKLQTKNFVVVYLGGDDVFRISWGREFLIMIWLPDQKVHNTAYIFFWKMDFRQLASNPFLTHHPPSGFYSRFSQRVPNIISKYLNKIVAKTQLSVSSEYSCSFRSNLVCATPPTAFFKVLPYGGYNKHYKTEAPTSARCLYSSRMYL